MMKRLSDTIARLRRLAPPWGTYVMLELLLPGGTLVALLVFLYQRKRHAPAPNRLVAGRP